MTVLQVNKFFWLKGGSEKYLFEVMDLLGRRGHEVLALSMKNPKNRPWKHDDLFVSEIDYDEDGSGALAALRTAANVVYSREAARKAAALLDRAPAEVAHLHNYAHQLSPSILDVFARRGVAVVQTLHDYKAVCPTYRFYRDGAPCEACLGRRFWQATAKRCNRGSALRSLTNTVEMTWHTARGTYDRGIQLYVAPSLFLRNKVVEHGLPAERVVHQPYAIDLAPYQKETASEDRLLYAGRLSDEKGIGTLLEAVRRAPKLQVDVAGEGPEGDRLRAMAEREGLTGVRFLSYLEPRALAEALARARALVVPSEWYENSPLIIYEAFASGTPVVGSRMGGIPELVDDETGWTFEAGNPEDLAAVLSRVAADPDEAKRRGRAARARAFARYSAEDHYEPLRAIYEEAERRRG